MTTQRNRRAKKIEVNLNYLRNDLDIWNHRVISWLDAKSQPQQNEIEKFGIEVVQKLCTRKILKMKDLYGMKFPERPLTPRRSGSASPNRPTTPDSASSRLKSITRVSLKDRHHDCQKKLDFDDDEDGYKVDAYTNPATCAHDETFYQCRISLLEKQKIKLEKEVRMFESLANEYIHKFRDLKNMMDRKRDACPDCKMKEQHMQRYKAERSELKVERQRLEKSLANLSGERNEFAEKLQKKELDIAELQAKNENLKSHHAEEIKKHIESDSKFQHEISNLKIEKRRVDLRVTNAEKELEEMTSKCNEQKSLFYSKRNQSEREIKELRLELDEMRKSTDYRWSKSAKRHVYEPEDEGFTDLNMLQRGTSSLPGCYSSVRGISDTEKENISLRAELTEALQNIENLSKKYSDLLEKYETGKIATKRTIESLQREKDSLEQETVNFRNKLDQIQGDLNRYKNEQVHEQDSSHGKLDNLLQQNRKLDNDRELLRAKTFSLEDDRIKWEDMFNKSKEDNKKLQREQDNLQDNLREKSNELKNSEVRLRKLEADIIFLQNTKTENEKLKESLHELEGVKRDYDNLEKRYQKETSDRMSSDNISTKYKEDNDRLRKERNSARTELKRVLREKKESYQNLNTEQVLAKEELQSKEREKYELFALFKDKEGKDLQKIKLYEKEIETLKSRYRDYSEKMRQSEHEIETLKSKRKDDNDKIQRFEYEIYTLKSSYTDENVQVQRMEHEIETSKSRHRDDNDKIQRMELEIETLKSKHRDDNNKMRQMEHEIETLKSRLSEEGNDQTLEQIGKGSIIRAQTMINYDLLLAEESKEVTKKVSELYEDKWEVAMIELGENGGKQKNIEFLLKILENAYSFCECLEGRLTDGFEQAMVNAATNIKEVVDTTVFVRPILERLERCIIQLFFRQYSQYQEYRTKEPVYSYITEALSLSWFLVTRNPRVSISTTIPDESHLQFYDTYSTDGSEVDYVVLPMITWSTNKREIIRKGIAAFK